MDGGKARVLRLQGQVKGLAEILSQKRRRPPGAAASAGVILEDPVAGLLQALTEYRPGGRKESSFATISEGIEQLPYDDLNRGALRRGYQARSDRSVSPGIPPTCATA